MKRFVTNIVLLGVIFILSACGIEADPKHDPAAPAKSRSNPEVADSSLFKMKAADLNACTFSFRPYSLKVLKSFEKFNPNDKVDLKKERLKMQMAFSFTGHKGLAQDMLDSEEVYLGRVHHLYEDSNPQKIQLEKNNIHIKLKLGPTEWPTQHSFTTIPVENPYILEAELSLKVINNEKLGFYVLNEGVRQSLPDDQDYTAYAIHTEKKEHFSYSVQVLASCKRAQDQ